MSGLKYKAVLALVLAFIAASASGCTTPVTINCAPLTCTGG